MPFNKEHKYRLVRYVTFLEKEIEDYVLIQRFLICCKELPDRKRKRGVPAKAVRFSVKVGQFAALLSVSSN